MKKLFSIFIILILISCSNQTDKSNFADDKEVPAFKLDSTVSINFANGYVELNNKMVGLSEISGWIENNNLLTDNFKKSYEIIIDNISKDEPLEADPIFDAQDYPDKGFEIESFDKNTGYIILKGIDCADLKILLKLTSSNDQTLVDGCGIVNIPDNKRIKR